MTIPLSPLRYSLLSVLLLGGFFTLVVDARAEADSPAAPSVKKEAPPTTKSDSTGSGTLSPDTEEGNELDDEAMMEDEVIEEYDEGEDFNGEEGDEPKSPTTAM